MTIDKTKVDRAIALIKKGSANADYFFEQLQSPDWIMPLAKEKLFLPYSAIRQGDTITFPVWGPGQYLARMAVLSEAQPQVLQILKELPESDNPRVYDVVAECAAVLPPAMATQLISQLLRGLRLPYGFTSPDKFGTVVKRLASEKFGADALRLAQATLAIQPAPPARTDTEDETDSVWLPRKAKGKIDDWSYGRFLDESLEGLVQSSGLQALRMLCDLLQEVVAQEDRAASEGPQDFSYIWRPTIEHSESHHENVKDDLVSGIRDAGNLIIKSTPELLREVVRHLEARPTRIFHRLALFLLVAYGDRDLTVVQEALDNPDDWNDPGLRPEYELLLTRFFDQLRPNVRNSFLGWVDKGPDIGSYVAFRTRMDGHEPDEAEVRLHREVWTRDHLAVLGDHLPPAYKERLQALEASRGPSREPGQPMYRLSVGWRGEHSPLTDEETLSLNWSALVSRLRNWSPPVTVDLEGPSLEGLASSVRQRVIANPQDAVAYLHEVIDVDPRYVAAILEALREAVRKPEVMDWQAILGYLARVVDQAHTALENIDGWRWVSKCAASLIDDSFDAGPASIPIEFRGTVWPILQRLAENPDPTTDHEARYGGTNMDPATLSINTVRGEAMHAVVRYALWWRRHLELGPDTEARLQKGFQELPEVRALLERHLAPATDPSLAVRAIYGQWFPWLVLLDPEWASGHVRDVFPDDADSAPLFWAAWGAYVVYCDPFANVLPILRPVYQQAIAAADDGMARKVGLGERPSEHLAQHLMAYYWRSELTLSPDDLVTYFFKAASPKLRGHALEWVGRILAKIEEPATAEVQGRLKSLWESRLSQAPVAAEELQAFGWWFGSGQLDQAWSLEMLQRVLASSVLPEPDHIVAQRLATIANTHALEAVLCLDRMVDLSAEGWSMHGWLDSARTILEAALKTTNPDARERAARVIHKFGTLRFRDFRALLKDIASHKVSEKS